MTQIPDLISAAALVSGSYSEHHGGRIIASLLASDAPDRQRLGRLILASLMQDVNIHAQKLLESEAGIQVSGGTQPMESSSIGIDPARPRHTRPNGSVYYARKWGKYWDVEVLQKARTLNRNVLLFGPPGTGKTAMAEAAFGDDLLTFVITGETRAGELVGGFVPDGKGGWLWVDGPLLVAVREGLPILVDEILLADPKVLSVLYPLMDGRNFLNVDENPEIGQVFATEGFYILGAGNPDVPGARMSPALLSRFPLQVEVTTDWDLAVALGVDETVVNLSSSLAVRQSGSGSVSWAPQMRELLDFQETELTWGREFALRNLMRQVPKGDYEAVHALASQVLPTSMLSPARI